MYHYSSSTVPSPKRYAFCLPTLHRDSGGKHRASVVKAVLTWSTAVSTAACAQGPGFLPHLPPAVSLRTTQDKRSSIPRRRKPSQKEQAVSVQQEQPCGGRLGWRCCGREADGADKPTACYTRALPLKEPHGQMAAEEPRGTQRGDCPEDMDCPRNVCT